jgi:hypothetical protein
VEHVTSLRSWFSERLTGVPCRPDTLAYVVGLMTTIDSKPNVSLVTGSIVLAFAEARSIPTFDRFQRIGDHVLWVTTMCPAFFAGNEDVSETIGRLSYQTCHRLMNRQWPLYEELADDLPTIAKSVRQRLSKAV